MATKTVKVEITGDPSGFQRSMSVVSESGNKAASELSGHASRIQSAFAGLDNVLGSFGLPFTGALSAVGAKIGDFESKGSSSFQKLASVGGTALLGLAAGAVAVGAVSLKLADDFETAHARLETAVKNTGTAFDAWAPKVDAVGKKLELLGFNSTTVQAALVPLIGATHDTQKALDLMGLAADIARGRHISLQDATALLTKVETGHVALLGRMGIATKDANGKTIDATTAVQRLTDLYGGSAQANAETFHGKVQVLTAQLQDLGIKIGQFLIPIITALAGAVSDAINWFEKHRTVAIALGSVVGGALLLAIAAYTASMISAAIATIAATWPILAIVAAIAAVVAAVYFLWTNWDQVWNWIKNHPAIAAIVAILAGPIAAFVAIVGAAHWLYDNWSDIWNTVAAFTSAVVGSISNFLSPIVDTLSTIIRYAGDAKNALSSIGGIIANPLGALGGALGLSEGGFVPGVGNTDSVPAMLTPGEFVVSKDMMRSGNIPALGNAATGGSSRGSSNSGQSSGPIVINLVVDGSVLAQKIIPELAIAQKRGTPVPW